MLLNVLFIIHSKMKLFIGPSGTVCVMSWWVHWFTHCVDILFSIMVNCRQVNIYIYSTGYQLTVALTQQLTVNTRYIMFPSSSAKTWGSVFNSKMIRWLPYTG